MVIMVSACLLGQNCKYSGGNNYSEKVIEFVKGHDIIPVCPEVEGGLPVPRIPCEIVNGIVTGSDGISRDAEFRKGAEKCLELAKEKNVDLAILQPRSPSCGAGKIYDGTFSEKLTEGNGVFAELLMENGIRVVDVEKLDDEGRSKTCL